VLKQVRKYEESGPKNNQARYNKLIKIIRETGKIYGRKKYNKSTVGTDGKISTETKTLIEKRENLRRKEANSETKS